MSEIQKNKDPAGEGRVLLTGADKQNVKQDSGLLATFILHLNTL